MDITKYILGVENHYEERRKKYKLDPNLDRTLTHGWLQPYLLKHDQLSWGRWGYLSDCFESLMESGKLPDRPIPQIEFCTLNDRDYQAGRKHAERCLDAIPKHGSWQGWSHWEYVNYLFDWLLFGFGHAGYPELPKEPHGCEGASMRVYQIFDLGMFLAHPQDYWGDILAESNHGKHLGFYPTPVDVCTLMAQMTFPEGEDCRMLRMLDPCVGTGRMLLAASNYTLRLCAQDIDMTVLKACLINGFMFVPWMVAPLPIDQFKPTDLEAAAERSEALTAAADPAAAEYLEGSEFDPETSYQFHPISKRRRKRRKQGAATAEEVLQGSLF